jgi:hypothetical protein
MSTSLTVSTPNGLARIDSIDAQFALFDRFNLARTMAKNYRFVSTGDEKHPYKLVKRSVPVSIFEGVNGIEATPMAKATMAERVHLNATKGRYNDENRLFEQDGASLEVGEVAAWSTL